MDDKKLKEEIERFEEYVETLDPGTEEYEKAVEILTKLRGMLPKPEPKKSKADYAKDFGQPAAMVLCAFMAFVLGLIQTNKVSEIENEGVVEKPKTMSLWNKMKFM